MKGISTDPGAYNPATTFTKSSAPNYRIGSETRKMFDDKKSQAIPGPGNYVLRSQAFETGKGFGMGLKLKEAHSTKLNVPGAGSYDPSPDKITKKAPGYSMGAKLKSELIKDTKVPGPGAYTGEADKVKQSAPRFGFGSSTRQEIGKTKFQTPGPGTYR